MIISEKQIHALMKFVRDYIEELKSIIDSPVVSLSQSGHENLDSACKLLNVIFNQQSEDLKEVS
jgi:hypothetical protein